MRALRAWILWTIAPFVLMAPSLAYSQTLSAMWDPNPSSDDVVAYEVCIGTTSLSCNFQLASVAASENSYTFTPSPGVLYRVAVRAVNASGPGPYSAEVLTSIPGLTQPANQTSTVNVAISPLSLSATDPDGGILQFSHSGLPFGLSLNQSTGIITGIPTSPGTFNVTIFVTDGTVTTSRTFVWTVNGGGADTLAPALSITSHTANQTVNASSITLAGTATDSGAGASGITGVTVNGTAANGGTSSGSTTANWNLSVALSVGANTFSVAATDGAGNVRTSSITINRPTPDTTAPTLSITSHTANQTVSSSSITVAGTATDSGAGGSGIANVTVNGNAASGGAASGNGTANWSRNVTLSLGANTITVVATDGASNTRTTSITVNYAISPVTNVTLTPSLSSPRPTGTAITFTAAGSGGVGPRQYKFFVQQGSGSPQMVRDWSTTTTYAWTPSATTNTTYTVSVWARSAGVTVDAAQASAQTNYVITVPTIPATGTTVTSNLSSPQNPGTPVTFTAAATGGTAPYSYKWWVRLDGGAWTLLQNWSTSTTLAWTPNASGTYGIGVWARSNNVTADAPQTSAIAEFVVNSTSTPPSSPPPAPPSSPTTNPPTYASLSANRTSPQPVGTTVTFSAGATGGASPYSYKWWVKQDGGAWTLLQDWNTSTTLAWTPNASGTYAIGLWARSNGVTADVPQTSTLAEFAVSGTSTPPSSPPPPPPSTPSPSLPPTNASLTANRTSPQPAGTTVTFSASASGGTSPYSYKWWVKQNGGAWTLLQDWSTSTSLAWTPNASGTYAIGLWARANGVTADAPQTSTLAEFAVSGTSTPPSSPPPTPPSTPSPSLPPTYASLTANQSSPQPVGTTVTFSAGASGGTSPYSYKWWVKLNGGAWTMLQDWSTSTSLTWTPNAAGTYALGIWARSNGVTADVPQTSALAEFVVSGPSTPPVVPPPPTPVVNPPNYAVIGVNRPGPQPTGTALTFSASASGGSSPYSYKWWIKLNGGAWTVLRDWNTSTTLVWTPTAPGTYAIGIWARSNTVTADLPQTSAILEVPVTGP